MKEKTIGIVLERMDLCRISGYLGKLETKVELDEFNRITAKSEISKVFFDYYPTAGYYEIAIGSFEQGKEIGKELEKLGIENLKFRFNDEMHII